MQNICSRVACKQRRQACRTCPPSTSTSPGQPRRMCRSRPSALWGRTTPSPSWSTRPSTRRTSSGSRSGTCSTLSSSQMLFLTKNLDLSALCECIHPLKAEPCSCLGDGDTGEEHADQFCSCCQGAYDSQKGPPTHIPAKKGTTTSNMTGKKRRKTNVNNGEGANSDAE